jgi:hypothetical protein
MAFFLVLDNSTHYGPHPESFTVIQNENTSELVYG